MTLSPARCVNEWFDSEAFSYPAASSLQNGGWYYWRVRAINGDGVAGAWSAKWTFKLNQLPAPGLSSPAAGLKTKTMPTLNWAVVPGATGYRIQIDNNQDFSSPTQTGTSGGTSYPVAPALPDGKYYWRVQAVNGRLGGKWSAVWYFTVDTTGPKAPVLLTPVNRAGTQDGTPTFTWNASAGAVGYIWRLRRMSISRCR